MKAPLLRCALTLAGALLLFSSSPVQASSITTPAEWTAAVAADNGGSFIPLKSTNTTPDTDQYAWAGYQWIEAYLALAQSTGDSAYMDTAKQIIDYMLSQRDDVRFASTPLTPAYWSAPTYYLYHVGVPAPGWRRIIGGHPEVSQLIDGRICESIILWCELARRGFPQYETAIAGYLPLVRQTLDMHLPSLFDIPAGQTVPPGDFYTPALAAKSFKYWRDDSAGAPTSDAPATWSGFMAVNHNCTFARAMLGYDSLTGTTTYQAQVQGVVNYYLNALDPSRPTIAAWLYSPLDPNGVNVGKMEDVNHATVTLSLIEEAYRVGGYGVDSTLVARLIQSFDAFYDDATGKVYNNVDGSGALQAETSTAVHSIGWKSWLWLSQFDPTIATRVRDTYDTYYTASTNSPEVWAGWANIIYWESLLAGTAAFDDSSIGSPGSLASTRPLYTDAADLLKWPYYSGATAQDSTTGAFEGATHRVISYTITNWQWAIAQYSFSPAENAEDWDGLQLAYQTTGPAAFSLTLSDGTNTMTATLPSQPAYALRTLHWSDFSNAAAVRTTALTTLRLIASGVASGSGTLAFDDMRFVESAETLPLYTDSADLLKTPYDSNVTVTDSATGAFEGSTHRVISYTVINWQWAFVQYNFSPALDATGWGGFRLAYQTTGSAAFSLTLSDGANTMTATLPTQPSYAVRTLRWSDFSNASAVDKSAIATLRIIANGVANATGQVDFDDMKLVQ